MSFKNYTTSILQAFKLHSKQTEIVKRKQEILANVAEFHNFTPNSVLYIGFSPAVFGETAKKIYLTQIDDDTKNFLKSSGINFDYIDEKNLSSYYKSFDVVIALDEYFTFAASDTEQKNKVNEICSLAKEYVITTCKDYKNQEFKDKEFSIPALIRNNQTNAIYLEFHNGDIADRNVWNTTVYEINNNQFAHYGPFARRAMFFKQLAKFSADAGAVGFSVHKNLMYKSLIKKNYEHVISIRF